MEPRSQQKRRLRMRILRERDRMPPADRDARSTRIARRLCGLPACRDARTVAAFATFRSEVDTRPLLDALLASGKTVALPRVTGPGSMAFHRIANPDRDLAPGTWGIPEPLPGLDRVEPDAFDLVIAPGAAFDARGHRIGFGGGYYDRYLRRLRPDCTVLSPAFEFQLVPRVPTEPFDEAVDLIVTEKRIIRTVARGKDRSRK